MTNKSVDTAQIPYKECDEKPESCISKSRGLHLNASFKADINECDRVKSLDAKGEEAVNEGLSNKYYKLRNRKIDDYPQKSIQMMQHQRKMTSMKQEILLETA